MANAVSRRVLVKLAGMAALAGPSVARGARACVDIDEYLTLIKAIDRKAFGVHLDVCNTMSSPARLYNNGAVIHECFAKLGPWIICCHAKDLQWGPGYQVDAPLMPEHLRNEVEYTKGREYIPGVARAPGLSFGTAIA